MTPWLVVSPEYDVIDVICDGQGPLEPVRDVVFVEAETKRDARILALRLFRQQRARCLRYMDCPISALECRPQVCSVHGTMAWCGDHYACGFCDQIQGLSDAAQ